MAAAAGSSREINIYCSTDRLYESTAHVPHKLYNRNFSYNKDGSVSDPSSTDKMSLKIIDFLQQHGVNAKYAVPPQSGVQTGGIGETAVTAIKIGKILFNTVKWIQEFREGKADKTRRSFLPNVTVRIEASLSDGYGDPANENLEIAQHLVALLGNISDFVRKEFPMCRVEYLVVVPRGKRNCFSIHISDPKISSLRLLRVIRKLSKKKNTMKGCSVLFTKWPWITISSKTHRANTNFSCHHTSCEAPIYDYFIN